VFERSEPACRQAGFLNLAGRPETARLETIVGRILFGYFIFGRSK